MRPAKYFQKSSKGLWEMFEGDSADTCAENIPLVSMGGRAKGLACADQGTRTPIGASGICLVCQVESIPECFSQFIALLDKSEYTAKEIKTI